MTSWHHAVFSLPCTSSALRPLLSRQPRIFHCLRSWPFLECHTVRSVVAFPDGLLLLSDRHSGSSLSFHSSTSSQRGVTFHCLDRPQLPHSPAEGRLAGSSVSAVTNAAAVHTVSRVSCAHTFPAPSGKYQAAQQLDRVVGVGLVL